MEYAINRMIVNAPFTLFILSFTRTGCEKFHYKKHQVLWHCLFNSDFFSEKIFARTFIEIFFYKILARFIMANLNLSP